MLPAPAAIAAAPTPRSRASWNPAVPPPPVGGAAVGKTVGLSVVGGLYVADGLVAGDVVNDGSVDGLGVSLAPGLGVPAPAESLLEEVAEGDGVPLGGDEDEDDV